MKVDIEEIDACNRKLKIEIPLADYEGEVKNITKSSDAR